MIQVDRHTVIQVLGGLMNRPELLNDTDKYRLEVSDFATTLDKFIFSAIYNLYNGGAEKIRAVDIINYLKDNQTAAVYLEKENGEVFLQDCEAEAEPQNFYYYYNRLKKINFLKDIQASGHSIEQFYCEDIFNPHYNEINERFEKLTTKDILDQLKGEVNNYENKFVLNNVAEESKASDDIDQLIKDLKEKPEVGCQLQGHIFNTICRGGRKGKLYLRSASSGVGKAIPNYTIIPTPDGEKRVDEIKVGDYLFDRHGNPTEVLAIYPQKEKKQVYKVYFRSGRIAECCDEHLWSYYNSCKRDKYELTTSTLKELINSHKIKNEKYNSFRYSVPVNEEIVLAAHPHYVPPYIMGLLIGDASFRYSKSQKALCFSSNDEELVKSIADTMNFNYKKNSQYNYNWSFKWKDNSEHENVWVEEFLKEHPQLWQTKSETKFIPPEYLYDSIENRYDLLAGLLDTDGSIDKQGGRVIFTTVSPILRDNVIWLCRSLGMTTHVLVDKRAEKYTTGECYSIGILCDKFVKQKLFKLSRKKQIAIDYANNGKRYETRDRDAIIKIEATDKYTDMTCFYVDNEEHLFLMNDFIVTHNTRTMVGDAANLAYPIRFDTTKGRWICTGSAEKVLYVMTEQDPEEIKTMLLAYLTGYNEEIFLYGTYGEEEMPRIKIAIEIMKKYEDNLLFARIPDPSASVVKNLFRRYHIQYGVENFFYDYIFSSPAMLNEYRDLGLPEYVCLRLFTTALKNLAIELNSFVLTSTQVSNDDGNGGFKDYHNIQSSKAIANLVDFGCIMSKPTQEEINQLGEFTKNFSETPNMVTDVYKNRRGRWTDIRIWSRVDLGRCLRKDLFMTTSSMAPIDDFSLVDFENTNYADYQDLLDLYNDGIISDDLIENRYGEELTQISNLQPEDLLDNAGEAFEIDKDVTDKSFGELLGF